MTFMDILSTVFEFAFVGAVVWGIFNEDRLVAFERKIKAHFRRKSFKVVKGNTSIRPTQF